MLHTKISNQKFVSESSSCVYVRACVCVHMDSGAATVDGRMQNDYLKEGILYDVLNKF